MLNLAIFGPPGAGKGTQAQMLVEKYKLSYISTGEILRKEIASKSTVGLEAQKIIEQGKLVGDDIMAKIIEAFIEKSTKSGGILFDGYPRTIAQAEILETLLNKYHLPLAGLIALEVDGQILIERMLKRATIEQRSDDTEEAIANRLKEYANKTLPVVDYYKKQNKYFSVVGTGTVEEVHNRIAECVNSIINQ